jgi:hypothetical protein
MLCSFSIFVKQGEAISFAMSYEPGIAKEGTWPHLSTVRFKWLAITEFWLHGRKRCIAWSSLLLFLHFVAAGSKVGLLVNRHGVPFGIADTSHHR